MEPCFYIILESFFAKLQNVRNFGFCLKFSYVTHFTKHMEWKPYQESLESVARLNYYMPTILQSYVTPLQILKTALQPGRLLLNHMAYV